MGRKDQGLRHGGWGRTPKRARRTHKRHRAERQPARDRPLHLGGASLGPGPSRGPGAREKGPDGWVDGVPHPPTTDLSLEPTQSQSRGQEAARSVLSRGPGEGLPAAHVCKAPKPSVSPGASLGSCWAWEATWCVGRAPGPASPRGKPSSAAGVPGRGTARPRRSPDAAQRRTRLSPNSWGQRCLGPSLSGGATRPAKTTSGRPPGSRGLEARGGEEVAASNRTRRPPTWPEPVSDQERK